MAKRNLNDTASSAIKSSHGKSFDLDSFKKSKYLSESSKFKKQRWIPFSPAVSDALSIQGIPMGQVTIARGGSDTGKTTLTYPKYFPTASDVLVGVISIPVRLFGLIVVKR